MNSMVVMGVAGCGKSSLGAQVAARLQLPMLEGDAFHDAANLARMRDGVALTDAERSRWLDRLGEELARRPAGAVLSCSALRASYRQRLRDASPGLRFVWLELDLPAALARVAGRSGHFFPAALVATQFETLEPPRGEPGVLRLDATRPAAELVPAVEHWWRGRAG